MSNPKELTLFPRKSPRDLPSSRCHDTTYGTGDMLNLGDVNKKSSNIELLINDNIKSISTVELTKQPKIVLTLMS